MTKILLGFQLFSSSLIHLLCCGLPILISINGGLSVFVALQTFTPVLIVIQLVVLSFTYYQLYKPVNRGIRAIRNQRIIFWAISILSFVLFFYPPAHWFKSEETKLKEAQIERFFKTKIK